MDGRRAEYVARGVDSYMVFPGGRGEYHSSFICYGVKSISSR